MICEDFIMLGRTVPEASKRHGLVVCSAGYSPETRCFMRIYPLLPQDKIPRWSICRLSLERPRFDNRKESWRLKNDSVYEITGKADKAQQFEVLKSMRSKSIKRLFGDEPNIKKKPWGWCQGFTSIVNLTEKRITSWYLP